MASKEDPVAAVAPAEVFGPRLKKRVSYRPPVVIPQPKPKVIPPPPKLVAADSDPAHLGSVSEPPKPVPAKVVPEIEVPDFKIDMPPEKKMKWTPTPPLIDLSDRFFKQLEEDKKNKEIEKQLKMMMAEPMEELQLEQEDKCDRCGDDLVDDDCEDLTSLWLWSLLGY